MSLIALLIQDCHKPSICKQQQQQQIQHLWSTIKAQLNEIFLFCIILFEWKIIRDIVCFLKILFIFNWRIITLQYCDFFFCYALIRTSLRHTCVPSIPNPASTSLSTPSLQVVTKHWFGCPALYIKLPLAIYFTYGNVYVSVLFSQIIPPSPSPTESKSPFFMSRSPLLPWM